MVILKGLKCLEKGQHIAIAKTAIGVQNGGVLKPKMGVIRHLC